jgi:hypothetical protein
MRSVEFAEPREPAYRELRVGVGGRSFGRSMRVGRHSWQMFVPDAYVKGLAAHRCVVPTVEGTS